MPTLTIRPPKDGRREQPEYELSQSFLTFSLNWTSPEAAMRDLAERHRETRKSLRMTRLGRRLIRLGLKSLGQRIVQRYQIIW